MRRFFFLFILFVTPLLSAEEPLAIVIFGANGDLASCKVLPALYNLSAEGKLPQDLKIIGVGRRDYSDEKFREETRKAIETFSRRKDLSSWKSFESKLSYVKVDFSQDTHYQNLEKKLISTQNRLYYLSTKPSFFPQIVEKLHAHHLISSLQDKTWSRVMIEKPFGQDLESATELQKELSKYLDESQTYRLDHYLGKAGTQNLMNLRFKSALFESFWNKEHIDQVQITLSEEIGIGSRAEFWEETGLLRDLFQNHLMQLLALTTMEPPKELTAEAIHAEKIKLLKAIHPFSPQEVQNRVVRGQYGPNVSGLLGYRQEKGVPAESSVETFVAAKFSIDNPRWQGVPFYIRAGKRLDKQTAEIAVSFKNGDKLFIRIQPNTGIFLQVQGKSIQPLTLTAEAPEAYENLISAAVKGDKTLFVESDEQLLSWKILAPILQQWKVKSPPLFPNYEAGSFGPTAAEELLKQEGRNWITHD